MYSTKDGYLNQSPVYGGAMDDFGVTDAAADSYRENFLRVQDEAARFGLNTSPGAMDVAMELVSEYGVEWVLEAIRIAVDTPKWKYVKGVLRRAREQGAMRTEKKTSRRTVDQGETKSGKELLEKWGYREL